MPETTFTKSVAYVVRAAHTEENWIHPLRDVLGEVTIDEAKWKPASDVASIWEVTAHLTPYLQGTVRRLRDEAVPEIEDWPTVADKSDAAWESLRAQAIGAIDALGEEVAKLDDASLERITGRGTPAWESIADIAIHNAYHAGQIVKLRQLCAAAKAAEKEPAHA